MKILKKYFFTLVVILALSIGGPIVHAEPPGQSTGGATPGQSTTGATPGQSTNGGTQTVVNPSGGFQIQNPINANSICDLVKRLLAFVLTIGTPVAAVFLAIAGFRFVLARGNPEGLKRARDNLVAVLLGIFIFMAAWLLGQVIANTLKALSPTNAGAANSC